MTRVLEAKYGISATREQSHTAAYPAALFGVSDREEGTDGENKASGGVEDYEMRGVGLIRAARPPWLLHELNGFDRSDPRPS